MLPGNKLVFKNSKQKYRNQRFTFFQCWVVKKDENGGMGNPQNDCQLGFLKALQRRVGIRPKYIVEKIAVV